jgi:hypothetical protein
MAPALLTVPVPDLDVVVRRHLDPARETPVPPAPEDHLAHVLLLTPFGDRDELTDGVRSELRRFFGDVTPFPFTIDVPGGRDDADPLTPSPAAPFRQLALALARRFPEHHSVMSAFEAVPHVVVPALGDEGLTRVVQALAEALPLSAYAQEAALLWSEPDGCETLEIFPFGTTAA